MADILDGFTGKVLDGVSIGANISEALEATKNMPAYEKAQWLRAKVVPEKDWDYKVHYGSEYEDFGNFHYGVITKALFDKEMVLAGAGGAQHSSNNDGYPLSLYIGTGVSRFFVNLDNKNDIPFVEAGIKAANQYLGLKDSDGTGVSSLIVDFGYKLSLKTNLSLNLIETMVDTYFTFSNKLTSTNSIFNLEKSAYDLYSNNVIKYDYYSMFSKNITNNLIYNNPQSPYYQPKSVVFLDQSPIGAFYESSTNQIDNSESIAQKTYKLLNSSNESITKEQLENLDLNQDGRLSGSEISSLNSISLVKFSFFNNKFYQANFFELDLKEVA